MDIGSGSSSMSDNEFVKSVWRENREHVGVLTDDFVARFSNFANWNLCLRSMV